MTASKKNSYRDLAFSACPENRCVYCGFGVRDVLEVAHLDQDRSNNSIENLAVLCPNCHKMHDLDLIPTDVILRMREHEKVTNWKARMKDAGAKAGATRKANTETKRRSAIANKAVATRKAKAEAVATIDATQSLAKS